MEEGCYELKIDPELKMAMPPLSDTEYRELEANLNQLTLSLFDRLKIEPINFITKAPIEEGKIPIRQVLLLCRRWANCRGRSSIEKVCNTNG